MNQDTAFNGFQPITGNFVYCPNQFFDVCMTDHSRSVVRLVAFILRKTLGWLDKNGNPIEENISVSYDELIKNAGVSRGSIGKAIEEAVKARFIVCTQKGKPKKSGDGGCSAKYSLRWDNGSEYVKDTDRFDGFFAGEGHRSPIPNGFFDHVVVQETLAVIKVVGSVLRHTVGYQNQFGGRRSNASLSFSYIQKYGNIQGRHHLSPAIKRAIDAGYIACVQEGTKAVNRREQKAATYAVNWLSKEAQAPIGSKKLPEDRSNKVTTGSVQKGDQDRSNKVTSNGSEKLPEDQFKKVTTINTYSKNNPKYTHKDQSVSNSFLSEETLARAFYEEWMQGKQPTESDLSDLRQRIDQHGIEAVESAMDPFIATLSDGWQDCKSLSGAIKQGYLDIAIERQKEAERRKQFSREQTEARRLEKEQDEQQRKQDEKYYAMLKGRWLETSKSEREAIRKQAISESENTFLKPQYRKSSIDENANLFLLDYFANKLGLAESCHV